MAAAAFKASDVQRAITAARAAGFDVDELRIDPRTGELTLRSAGRAPSTVRAVEDEIANWAAKRGPG